MQQQPGGLVVVVVGSEEEKAEWPNLCFGLSIITNCLVLAKTIRFSRLKKWEEVPMVEH